MSAGLSIRLLDRSRCRVRHLPTGAELVTDAAPELGGGGTGFSSTDLLAAALGSCVGSSLAPMAEREGIDLGATEISVRKVLDVRRRRLERLSVEVRFATDLTDRQLRKLDAAARSCIVHRSLSPEIDVRIELGPSAHGAAREAR